MNILITGNLTSLTPTLVNELIKRKHRLVLASDDAEKLGIESKDIIIHSVNPAGTIYRDAISAYGFDIIIYLSTREEQLFDEGNLSSGHQLDGLRNTLEVGKNERLKHFFYISSTEVYGNADDVSEKAIPQPASLNGHTLLAGEAYCRIYHELHGLNITVLRLPNIFGPDEKSGLLYRLILDCNRNSVVTLPENENSEISLLHVLDVTDFLIRAMDEEYTSEAFFVNLSSSNPILYADLARQLQKHYPEVTIGFAEDQVSFTKPAKVSIARRIYDWVDTHSLENELEAMVEQLRGQRLPKKSRLEGLRKKLSDYPEILKWVELIAGTVVVQLLSQMTGTLIQFKYVDFRLLFVVIMGSIYGMRTGLYAAALVSLSILFTWIQLGFDWALLIYNVGNWLPFALYFTAGLITGYYHDKNENEILNAQKQTSLIYDKYAFLYEVFKDIRNLKDEFRERLLGYRESYGKIYTITRELDQLQEHAVYLRALNILEEHMDNKDIAIYSLGGDGTYARLQASSVSLNGSLSKSINLLNFPEVLPYVEKGIIFQNSSLLPGYPAYLVPIFNHTHSRSVPEVMIVLWSAKFEQYSTYYYNRLKVICGLIQASLVRTALFSNANLEKTYLPKTKVLTQQAFMDTLKVRVEMKKNKVSDFQLMVMETPNTTVQDIYSSISEGIRTSDVVGLGNDGDYYVLLSQADKTAAQDISERLARHGIQSKLVDANQVLVE